MIFIRRLWSSWIVSCLKQFTFVTDHQMKFEAIEPTTVPVKKQTGERPFSFYFASNQFFTFVLLQSGQWRVIVIFILQKYSFLF
jgi:hypothetical protein